MEHLTIFRFFQDSIHFGGPKSDKRCASSGRLAVVFARLDEDHKSDGRRWHAPRTVQRPLLRDVGSLLPTVYNSIHTALFMRGRLSLLFFLLYRFIEEYKREGVPIWAVTTQNEPFTGSFKSFPWQTLYFSALMQR